MDRPLLVDRHPANCALRVAPAQQNASDRAENNRTSANHRTLSMREFFTGWRRKIGVVTLGLACAFAGLWVRSGSSCDVILVKHLEARAFAASSIKGFSLGIKQQEFEVSFQSTEPNILDSHSIMSWKWIGPFLWIKATEAHPVFDFRPTFVPYWSIVIPLALLSTYLLLSKPRPTKKLDASLPPDPDHA